jgi:hypothetical protein
LCAVVCVGCRCVVSLACDSDFRLVRRRCWLGMVALVVRMYWSPIIGAVVVAVCGVVVMGAVVAGWLCRAWLCRETGVVVVWVGLVCGGGGLRVWSDVG